MTPTHNATAYRTKRWSSLTDLRIYLTRTNAETIKSFNGHELVTNKGSYSLLFGNLTFHPAKGKKT